VKQVFFRQGALAVDEVPPPAPEPGSVLVRNAFSCVSPGTELAGLRASGKPLWSRVLSEPHNVRKALQMVAERGLYETLRAVRGRVDAPRPTGYSACGTVIAVGEGVSDLAPGERVACAGAEHAYHAEVIRVPRNLCLRVPEGVSSDAAATVTLGAIALQGVRRAQPTLGETFAVIGLGALGQIAAQLLKANGCRVIALDVDAARISLALSLGADFGASAGEAGLQEAVFRATDGYGADGVLITASGSSDEIVSLAFRLCRKKGRVVLVGDVGLNIDRADIYEKELDFLVSTSYGPGRYDRRYEEDGLDYPIGYVRWTENRNMAEYLSLLAQGRVRVEKLIGGRFPVEQAGRAYDSLKERGSLLAVLEYAPGPAPSATVRNPAARPLAAGRVRLGLIGAGSFLKGSHLPALSALSDRYAIRAVASRTGHNAQETARATGAAYGTTDVDAVLADKEVDAVLIATRHHLHADLALRALRAGKHVLVEKPLVLKRAELDAIRGFYGAGEGGAPVLLTGFNRRFSAYATLLRERLARAGNPPMLDYRMNAGHLPAEHWVHGPEGGGRNLGEACHIYDLFTYLTGARIASVRATALAPRSAYYRADDNFSALLGFEGGAVATLLYTAMGDASQPKEQMDAYCDGEIHRLDDYRRLSSSREGSPLLETRHPEKGLRQELEAFAAALAQGRWPIPLWQQLQAMDIALRVDEQFGARA
jgi:predicted dehydrogenase/threonine dehydrogenase-like Zn-dependent dehydrogenase